MYTCLKLCIQHTVFLSIWSHISGHLCWTSQSIKDVLLKRAHGEVWFHQDVLKRAVWPRAREQAWSSFISLYPTASHTVSQHSRHITHLVVFLILYFVVHRDTVAL